MKFDYSDIGSKVYSRAFWAICIFVSLCLVIGIVNREDVVEILRLVLSFAKYALAIFALPVSLQIAGEFAHLLRGAIPEHAQKNKKNN